MARSFLRLCLATVVLLAGNTVSASAQQQECRFICDLQWKVEPTFTVENLARRHRVIAADGITRRVARERVFETVLALDLETTVPRLGFSVEAIASPFNEDNAVELEFEANAYVLTEEQSRGWISSHVDLVDQFSPAERPHVRRAYTHKLDFEWDTAFHVFNSLPEGRWLRGLELETSLDYLATGIPKRGDVFADGSQFLDDASHWSLSFVIVVPVAPF
jgi:hypothetical protein